MCQNKLTNLLHLLLVAPLLIYVGLQGSKCHKMCFKLLLLLGLVVFAYHGYRYLMASVDHGYSPMVSEEANEQANEHANEQANEQVNEQANEQVNVEMEVIDVESDPKGNSSPNMFEPAFDSNNSNDSMDAVEGFTW